MSTTRRPRGTNLEGEGPQDLLEGGLSDEQPIPRRRRARAVPVGGAVPRVAPGGVVVPPPAPCRPGAGRWSPPQAGVEDSGEPAPMRPEGSATPTRHPGEGRSPGASATTRVGAAAAAGACVGVLASLPGSWQIGTLIGWDVAAGVYVAWTWATIWRRDPPATARLALRGPSGSTRDGPLRAAVLPAAPRRDRLQPGRAAALLRLGLPRPGGGHPGHHHQPGRRAATVTVHDGTRWRVQP